MNTQSQAAGSAGSESIRRVVPDLVGTATVVDESTADHIVKQVEAAAPAATKKSIFGRSKDHGARNKGKYSFAAGIAVGAAAGIGYSIWKVGGSAAAAEVIGDTPV